MKSRNALSPHQVNAPNHGAWDSYSTRLDADLAKVALAADGTLAVVVGVGSELQGGASGVQLRVPDESVEAAQRVLEHS